jgi:hypothetical protein
MTGLLLFWSIFSHRYCDKPRERTNNGKVPDDISIRHQYGEYGEAESCKSIYQLNWVHDRFPYSPGQCYIGKVPVIILR